MGGVQVTGGGVLVQGQWQEATEEPPSSSLTHPPGQGVGGERVLCGGWAAERRPSDPRKALSRLLGRGEPW